MVPTDGSTQPTKDVRFIRTMHIFSQNSFASNIEVPSLYTTGFVQNKLDNDGKIQFRQFESIVQPVFGEGITKAKDYLRNNNKVTRVPSDELAYIYGASYNEWKDFVSEIKGRAQHIQSLCDTFKEEKLVGNFVTYPTRSKSTDLENKEAVLRNELNIIQHNQIRESKIEALKRIKDWNESVASVSTHMVLSTIWDKW
jgi:hypothetical protein